MNNDINNNIEFGSQNETKDNQPEIKAVSDKKTKNKKNPLVFIIATLIVIFLLFKIIPIGEFLEFDKGEGIDVAVEIPMGSSADKIADILIEKKVIESKLAFKLKLKTHKKGSGLKYGNYTLNTSMTLSEIIDVLSKGHQEGFLITIPEGYSVEMIAALCEEKGICSKEEFLYAVNNEHFDYEFLKNIESDVNVKYRLQGFLFPDTYEYNSSTTAKDMINSMLKAYENNAKIPTSNGELDYYEILTLASIVEREAKIDSERAKIAGVFMNRLKIDMPLQACATVIYAKTDGAYDMETVLYSDLEVKSPYNTYKNSGLPVGPICNPGKKAIEAVINPESHNYLYYHTDENKKDGSHIFTENYQQHSLTQQ